MYSVTKGDLGSDIDHYTCMTLTSNTCQKVTVNVLCELNGSVKIYFPPSPVEHNARHIWPTHGLSLSAATAFKFCHPISFLSFFAFLLIVSWYRLRFLLPSGVLVILSVILALFLNNTFYNISPYPGLYSSTFFIRLKVHSFSKNFIADLIGPVYP